MAAPDAPLDGNAAAGLLADCFRLDLTSALVVCAACGNEAPLAAHAAYALEMGAVLRCRACDGVVLRIGRTATEQWVDVRGSRVMRLARPT